MLSRNSNSFIQKYEHPYVREIQLYYDDHTCRILFTNGTEKEHSFHFDAVYISQFGVPLSKDGSTIFISDWEKGLFAYSTDTGKLRWHFKSTKIVECLVCDLVIVATKRYDSLLVLDIETGRILKQLKSRTIESVFQLTEDAFLVNSLRGKITIVETATLETLKVFSEKEINPHDCLSLIITNATIQDGNLVLCGFEGYRHKNHLDDHMERFERVYSVPQFVNPNS